MRIVHTMKIYLHPNRKPSYVLPNCGEKVLLIVIHVFVIKLRKSTIFR